MKTLRLFALVCIVFGFAVNIARAQFRDDFNSTTLDPAWTVVQTWPGGIFRPGDWGTYLPGNHYSLTDNPGYLRYMFDPMTHPEGFQNNYESYISYYKYDAGLELHRTFSGDNWRFEAKGIFNLPQINGRAFVLRLYFGDGGPGTYFVSITRGADLNWNGFYTNLNLKTGPAYNENTQLAIYQPNWPWYYGNYNYPPPTPQYYRVQRDGGILTVFWSDDGAIWHTAWSYDLGTALDGLEQRLVITGLCWFYPAGSYADWDYVSVEATECTPPESPVANEAPVTYDGLEHTANAIVPPDISLVWYDAETEGNVTTQPTGTNSGTYTAYAESVNNITGCRSINRTSVTLTINKATLIVTAGDKSSQYSDPLENLTYEITGFVNGETSSVVSGVPALSTMAEASSAPGDYPITVLQNSLDAANYNFSFENGFYTIHPEKVCTTYNGTIFANTSDPAGLTTATIQLSVVLAQDDDGNSGDLSKGDLIFTVSPDNYGTASPAGDVEFNNGTFSQNFVIGFKSGGLSTSLGVSWSVSGYFTDVECGEKQTIVTVSAPANDFATGGGFVILTEASGGIWKGSEQTKNNFGFNIKWSKDYKKLSGNLNTIWRKDGIAFQARSNKAASLKVTNISVDPELQIYKADITYTNVNMRQLCDNGWSDGNGTVILTVRDLGEPGSNAAQIKPDQIGIAVKDKNGLLIFSSNTFSGSTNMTNLQDLDGGNIQVRQSATSKGMSGADQIIQSGFNMVAYPNPFTDHLFFDLQVKEGSKITLEIFDVNGSKVATLYDDMVAAFDNYRFEFDPVSITSGLYFYRLTFNGQVFTGKVVYRR